MESQPYKYRLKALFTDKFGCTQTDAKEFFANHYQVSIRTVQRDLSILLSSSETIPLNRVEQYAQFLNVPAITLRNHKTIKESWPL